MGIFDKIKKTFSKTSNIISNSIDHLFYKKKIDEDTLSELEKLLIMSDVSVIAATKIIERVRKQKFSEDYDIKEIKQIISSSICDILSKHDNEFVLDNDRLNIVLMYGVNGNGKTTTVGKLASRYMKNNKSVAIAACDTFRAAAVEQLLKWANISGSKFYSGNPGEDPASVAYKAVNNAISDSVDVLLIDTAGRLHNKTNLMMELDKIKRVIIKACSDAKSDSKNHNLLVLDGTTGQNAIMQTREFQKIVPISGLIITKLDGTAKGGAVISISEESGLPIYFIGTGEKSDDIKEFNPKVFSDVMVGLV